MTKNRKWTDEELATLREMWPTNFAYDIAQVINHSEDTIRNKALKLGLKKANDFDYGANYGRFTRKGKYFKDSK